MTDLLTRLEQAEGGSRELSCLVVASCPDHPMHSIAKHIAEGGKAYNSADLSRDLFVTQSLDAALTLVPEGCGWDVGLVEPGDAYQAHIMNDASIQQSAKAATPALALCIAALRARK